LNHCPSTPKRGAAVTLDAVLTATLMQTSLRADR
jgi:hypothetical protein